MSISKPQFPQHRMESNPGLFDFLKEGLINPLAKLMKGTKHQQYADCLIRNESGQLLLLRRSQQDSFEPGKMCLPGGKIEDGELPIEAAKRELYEETGLTLSSLRLVDLVQRSDSVSYYYEAYVTGNPLIALDNEEHHNYEWVDLNNLGQHNLLMDLGSILSTFIKKELITPCSVSGVKSVGSNTDLLTIEEIWGQVDATIEILTKGIERGLVSEKELKSVDRKMAKSKAALAFRTIQKAFNDGKVDDTTYIKAARTYNSIKNIPS